MNNIKPHNIISMDSSETLLKEVTAILDLISPDIDTDFITSGFNMTVDLYEGRYPGYRSCNTEYHDLHHTIETFLATARLLHGAILDGGTFTNRHVSLGLVSALLHDAGYIQEESDRDGTGAKYTTNHVRRSMDFLERHGSEFGLSHEEIAEGKTIILCTDLAVDISAVVFTSAEVELLGKILGSADLLAQMADRAYLEKLLFLYREFKEAGINYYLDDVDFLQKTLEFYELISRRFKTALDETERFMNPHFRSKWGIDENLYNVEIEKHKNYLKKILKNQDSDPYSHLRRGGIVDKIRKNSLSSKSHIKNHHC